MNKRDQQRTLKRLRKEHDLAEQNWEIATDRLHEFAREICPFKEGDKFHYQTGFPNRDFIGVIHKVAYSYDTRGPGYYIRAKRLLRKPARNGRLYSEETINVNPQFIRVIV